MKINKEQFEILTAKLDCLLTRKAVAVLGEDAKALVDESIEREKRIENSVVFWAGATKGLAERLQQMQDKTDGRAEESQTANADIRQSWMDWRDSVEQCLKEIKGALLHQQFKSGKRPKRKAAKGKGVKRGV